MQPTTELIGTAEAAEILGVDRATLTRWVDAGKVLPAAKIGGPRGAYLFDRQRIERMAMERVTL